MRTITQIRDVGLFRFFLAFFMFLISLVPQLEQIECSNLEIRLPVVKEGPLDSMFGLSIAEHILTKRQPIPENGFQGSLVLVGAPTYEAPDAIVPKTGGVFKCPLTTLVDDCEDMMLDTDDNEAGENKTDQWLGVTVRSQGPGGKVAVCAHRYKVLSPAEISGLGKCLLQNADLSKDEYWPEDWMICKNKDPTKKKYGYCQAGTGFYITQDDEPAEQIYIAGTPGAGDWRGGVFTSNILSAETFHQGPRQTTLKDASTGVGLNSYLGFALTSGNFGPHFLIASGAPRHNAIGAVVMLKFHSSDSLKVQSVVEGEQITESFGYEVCAADLDGDGYDDLIVGAPNYFDRDTEAGGRVYIYLNKKRNASFADTEPIRLTGPRDSMFGIAITNLRDLNLDGYEDIAIGAPYEDNGKGAVYIYLGGPDGVVQPASQKITPADLPDGLPTTREISGSFGYSLSGGVDLDGNQYPDLSIGAFEANSIVTLRARPIINVTAELFLEVSELDANDTNFVYNGKKTFRFYVEARMKYICNADEFDAPIRLEYSIEAEEERRNMGYTSRIIFEDTNSYAIREKSINLRPQSEEIPKYTPRFWAILRPGFKDIFHKIPFKLTYRLPDVDVQVPASGESLPDINQLPILNSLYDPSYTAELDFIKACAQDDGKCITDLHIEASLRLEGQPPILRVGVHNDLYLDVVLRNREEPAYDAKLTITFPAILRFRKIEDDASQHIRHNCNRPQNNGTVILCELGNPYPELEVERFTIKFDTSSVPSDAGNFTIMMRATATNEDSHPEDNEVALFAEVESITDIELSGETNAKHYTFGGEIHGESAMKFTDQIGAEVIHTWRVLNKGPGIVPESVLTIDFPYEVANGKWLLYMTHMPEVLDNKGHCEIDPIYVNELKLKERAVEPTDTLLSTPAQPAAERPPSVIAPSTDDSVTPTGVSRKRRDVGTSGQKRSRTQRNSNGQTQPLEQRNYRLDCQNGKANCFEFKCYINRLGDDEEAKVVVRSRLWNSTFLEDYIKSVMVYVISSGEIEILNAPFLTQSTLENDDYDLRTTVKPDVQTLPPPEPLPWWIILLAVLGGLLILILLILLLWKVGFFRRPGTRSSGGPCGFFERKTMGYKYATVTQKTPGGNAAREKTAYYDEKYFT